MTPFGRVKSPFYTEKKRKPFTTRTKKEEWRLSAGTVTFTKKSKCRVRTCRKPLTWGDRTYEFDHKDSNPDNNSQSNCYLVCRNCHGKHTRFGSRAVIGVFGQKIGTKRTKLKVGYKGHKTRTKRATKRRRRRETYPFGIKPVFRF
jgi:hypothetical protein